MSSRLASSAHSSPRRVTVPALPAMFERPKSATPRVTSPKPDTDTVAETLGAMKIEGDDTKVGSPKITQAAAIATTPPTTAQISIIVDEAGSPTQAVLPVVRDPIFGGPSPNQIPAIHPAQRVMANIHTLPGSHGFAPRPDRVAQMPTAANAQGLYPPDALIFVANLSNQRTEDQLEATCHATFDRYGRNHIKIRRDKNQHPFAFVQFEHVDDATAAAAGAFGAFLDGRKIRIEQAKAERAVILSKVDGANVTELEARHLLQNYGPLELVALTTTPNRRTGNMVPGVFVRFAYYLDCRDALRYFDNHNSGYQLFMAPSLEPRVHVGPDGGAVIRGFAQPRSAIDQKSVYVGNLPEGTTRSELEHVFGEFGRIVQVNVIKKHYDEGAINNFAFVEFSHAHEAALATSSDRYLHGVKLRVEGKEYSARHHARLGAPGNQVAITSHNNAGGNEGAMNTTRRVFTNNGRYGGRSGRHGYNHAHPGGQGFQPHMTPPATVQYQHQGIQRDIFGTPHRQAIAPGYGMITPPSNGTMHMNLLPTNMFSPIGATPPHFGDGGAHYQAAPFGTTPAMQPFQTFQQPGNFYVPQTFQPIHETGEEAQY